MAVTWLDFKTEVKKLLADVSASDDLFALACAEYVKAKISREVDHDLLMHKSYWTSFMELRKKLLGFTPTLLVGSTLDVAVKVLMPVDSQREGIQSFITQQIKNAYLEMTTLDAFIEKSLRSAVIDMMSYIPCYRIGKETVYTSANVTTMGNMSRGPMPDGADLREAFFLLEIDALAENVAYSSGDYVSSNGRTYIVLASGSLTTGQLGSGLQTTDGTVEVLGGMQFMFFYGEACLRSNLVVCPWKDRYQFNKLLDGCKNSDRDRPAMIAIDPEAFSFFVWPKLDSTHKISLFWSSPAADFSNGDYVPFDEDMQSAVVEQVLARYYSQIENDPQMVKLHGLAYSSFRARSYVNCKDREFLEYL